MKIVSFNCKKHVREIGFSYIEVLVATILIGVALVPALQTLETGLVGAETHELTATQQYYLLSRFEEVLAQPYSNLEAAALAVGSSTTPTSYSDTAGSNNRRLVFLSEYDGDNADADNDPFTGTDDGLMWVRIEIENSPLFFETLTSQ